MTEEVDKRWVKYLKDDKIIAIDPGASGGIAVYSVRESRVVEVVAMPDTPLFLLNFLAKWSKGRGRTRCYLEKVGGIPGQGGAASMFNFGRGFGHLEMALISLHIPTVEVTPQKWQKRLQLGSRGKMSANAWKTKLMTRAQQLFPYIQSDFGIKNKTAWMKIADSLLILEYARLEEKIDSK